MRQFGGGEKSNDGMEVAEARRQLPASRERWRMPCVGGGDAGRGYGGLVGAHWLGNLEDKEKLIDGTEGVEARRRRPASGGACLA